MPFTIDIIFLKKREEEEEGTTLRTVIYFHLSHFYHESVEFNLTLYMQIIIKLYLGKEKKSYGISGDKTNFILSSLYTCI